MAQFKTFIGPRLRQLRRSRGETQSTMAKSLKISPTYVNLLENNQRSVSVAVLLRLFESYGVSWQAIANDEDTNLLADISNTLQDPIFRDDRPDLQELRAALVHCPSLARSFLKLHQTYTKATERLMTSGTGAVADGSNNDGDLLTASPEAVVHNFFRQNKNHFAVLEHAAESFWSDTRPEIDDRYHFIKKRLRDQLGVTVIVVPISELPHTLREYNEDRKTIYLSEGLDHINRVFQLVHIYGLLKCADLISDLADKAAKRNPRAALRCRVELANYYAAAVLMPYEEYLQVATDSQYDFDHLATRFGVSFEQASHRATTLQREGAQGVPFFFLRIDKAGNVTKRFNSTTFQIAQFGGACPRWDIHTSFRTPGRIIPQFVEMPDGSKYFTISRTVDRPSLSRVAQDNRLAVTLGCSTEHVEKIGYATKFQINDPELLTPIGINCPVCPRKYCDQRAQQPTIYKMSIDEHIRGATRFES